MMQEFKIEPTKDKADYREKIQALAQSNPVLPQIVAKALNTNSMLAGAMLSEMCEKKMLKTSALKVGGSPLYLIPGKESQLLQFVNHLNEKDRKTVELLEKEKIIADVEADPLTRVSLGQVKDFAIPLIVEYEGKQDKFWKWFLLSDSDAEKLIGEKLTPKEKVQEKPQKKKDEKIQTIQKTQVQETLQSTQSSKDMLQKTAQPKEQSDILSDSSQSFWGNVEQFCKKNSIQIIEKSEIKKKKDFDLIVELPSPVGNLSYYCKVQNKKRVSDSDLSAVYVQGQLKKLPVILITDGELSKKALELLPKLKGMVVQKV